MNAEAQVRTLLKDLKAVCGSGTVKTIKRLETAVERLTTEIEVLRMVDTISPVFNKWYAIGLTDSEATLMEALEKAGSKGMTDENLMSATHAGKDIEDWPEAGIIKIWVCKIRPKLKAAHAPYHIATIWGKGYCLKHGEAPANQNASSRPSPMTYVEAAGSE